MYSDKRTVRGVKRKIEDYEDEQKVKPRTKFKNEQDEQDDDFNINLSNSHTNSNRIITSDTLSQQTNETDLNDKENGELKIDCFRSTDVDDDEQQIEFNNNTATNQASTSISDILNSTTYINETDLNDEIDKELINDESTDENESFSTFLNTSLSQCYVNNNRPLTPLPQLNTSTTSINSSTNPICLEQQKSLNDQRNLSANLSESQISIQTQSSSSSSSNQLNNCSTSSLNNNNFPALISNGNKFLFNSTSSSLFNAAAIVDTYFSSATKKSKLEKAKNMNHFRYSLFNKSLAKLNKFCNGDPNIRNSVLLCNTLKRLERQLRKENIYLHLTENGLAFIKLRNKRSPEQLDYRNLVLDETSQLYVETNVNEDEESDNEEENTDSDDKFGIDTEIDFSTAKQNDSNSSSCSSDSESDDQDEDSNNELNVSEYNQLNDQTSLDQDSSLFLEQPSDLLCNNELNTDLSTYLNTTTNSNNTINTITLTNSTTQMIANQQNGWTEEGNQFNWSNIFTNMTLCRENGQFDSSANEIASLNEQSNEQSNEQISSKEDELINNTNFLFNSIESQSVGQSSSTSTDELFSDIDSLITLYDFDLLTSVGNSSKLNHESNEQQQQIKNLNKPNLEDDNETISSNSQDSDTTLYTLDSAIGSMNSSINNTSLNNSISNTINNNSATSCSTSVSVNSSSTSFASNQSSNTISPVIS